MSDLLPPGFATAWWVVCVVSEKSNLLGRLVDLEEEHPLEEIGNGAQVQGDTADAENPLALNSCARADFPAPGLPVTR